MEWPEVAIRAAKEKLGSSAISVDLYNKSAIIVQQEFEKRGPEGFSFDILLI